MKDVTNTLPIQGKINLKKVPKEYVRVAEGMETQFLNHMLGEMRKSVQKSKPDSAAENYYNSMLDYERSKIMAETNDGVGIKELVLRDLLPKHLLDRATINPTANDKLNKYKAQAKMQTIASKTSQLKETSNE